MAYVILDKMTNSFLGPSGELVYHTTDAKTFSTKEAAEQYIDQHKFDYKGYDLKVVTESKQSKFSKSLKENMKALKESKVSDERVFPDTGEVSVVSKTGAYGIRIFIDARAFGGNPTLKLDISASYDGPYTPEAHKERPVNSNNVEKEIKQNIAELKRVLQRGIDRLDDDLSSVLKKMGYK